jgi:hypothetical protein
VDNDDNSDNWRSGVPRMPPFFSIPTKNASTNQRFFSTLLEEFCREAVALRRASERPHDSVDDDLRISGNLLASCEKAFPELGSSS